MSFEPILALLLIIHLRKTVQTFSPHPGVRKLLSTIIYGIIILAVLETVLPILPITKWLWHVALLIIIALPFRYPIFYPARTTMFAVLPLVVLSFIKEIMLLMNNSFSRTVDDLYDYAFPVALTWMIALLYLSYKQTKALKIERKRRLEEEEQNRIAAIRKAELEQLVAERTGELVQQKEELQATLINLKATQALLIQKEKMASLGELTAGIAHEIKNPLNFINNFSEINAELISEMQQELDKGNEAEAKKLAKNIEANSLKITHHGKLADAIVKSMLQHSRTSAGTKEATNINELVDEYLRLSYHGLRAKDKSFMVKLETAYDDRIKEVNVVPQDIGRVLLNLYNNAFYAVDQKKKNGFNNNEAVVSVRTAKVNGHIEIRVRDNGIGISQNIIDKIYQPFFTTKPTGQGTGLGLSLSYDIIKAHGGELKVATKEGEFSEFVVELPA
jgi:signal transduction histidine kinase